GKPDNELALAYARPAVHAYHVQKASDFWIDIYGLERNELRRQREDRREFLRGNRDNFHCLRIRFRGFVGCLLRIAVAATEEQRKCQRNDNCFHAFSGFRAKGLSASS